MATPQEALREMLAEREHRKAIMRSSNWIAAEEGGSREYIPVSSTPLDTAYQRSKSVTRSDYLGRLETKTQELRSQADKHAPAADFVSSRPGRKPAVWGNAPDTVGGMVLGFDGRSDSTSNTAVSPPASIRRAPWVAMLLAVEAACPPDSRPLPSPASRPSRPSPPRLHSTARSE
jgi:hypothetical protein